MLVHPRDVFGRHPAISASRHLALTLDDRSVEVGTGIRLLAAPNQGDGEQSKNEEAQFEAQNGPQKASRLRELR